MRKHVVTLKDRERVWLSAVFLPEENSARGAVRARILLLSDEGRSDCEITRILRVGRSTVERTRRKFAEGGLAFAIKDRPRSGKPPILGKDEVTFLLDLARTDPPRGCPDWTARMLADQLVELGVVNAVSGETVRRVLKKNRM